MRPSGSARVAPWSWIDALVLACGALGYYFLHAPFASHGMAWGDPSWLWHFGRRVVHGAVPYRDFVYQVGPLPVLVDASFQRVLGEGYGSSLVAGIALKFARAAVLYAIARRFVSVPAALAFFVFFTTNYAWCFWHHWGTGYVDLFALISVLFVTLAWQNAARRNSYLALAGIALAFVMSARQSNGVVMSAIAAGCTVGLWLRGSPLFTRKALLCFWSGYAGAVVMAAIGLASFGVLGLAIRQIFLDAPQKKNVSAVISIADAVSGGGLAQYTVDPTYSVFGGFLAFNAVAIIAVAFVYAFLLRSRGNGGVGIALIPLAILAHHATFFAVCDVLQDLPRVFASVTVLVAVCFPARSRALFGLEPDLVAFILGLPLGILWAMEMSYPGRGWGDKASLQAACILLFVASRRPSPRLKLVVGICLAGATTYTTWTRLKQDLNPFADDGTVSQNHISPQHPLLKGIFVNDARHKTLEWMRGYVRPGDTCFVYGNMPALYDLLDCKNPSDLDTAAADFFTGADGARAMVALRASPPRWIIAQEAHWMNPDLELPFNGDPRFYETLNPPASRVLHQGLRELLPRYELLEPSRAALTPADVSLAERLPHDNVHRIRLYRQRDRD